MSEPKATAAPAVSWSGDDAARTRALLVASLEKLSCLVEGAERELREAGADEELLERLGEALALAFAVEETVSAIPAW